MKEWLWQINRSAGGFNSVQGSQLDRWRKHTLDGPSAQHWRSCSVPTSRGYVDVVEGHVAEIKAFVTVTQCPIPLKEVKRAINALELLKSNTVDCRYSVITDGHKLNAKVRPRKWRKQTDKIVCQSKICSKGSYEADRSKSWYDAGLARLNRKVSSRWGQSWTLQVGIVFGATNSHSQISLPNKLQQSQVCNWRSVLYAVLV